MTRTVTIATMLSTDGTTTTYGIYQGRLHRIEHARDRQFFSLRTAEHVASVTHDRRQGTFDYLGAARQFETLNYPAFAWGKAVTTDDTVRTKRGDEPCSGLA